MAMRDRPTTARLATAAGVAALLVVLTGWVGVASPSASRPDAAPTWAQGVASGETALRVVTAAADETRTDFGITGNEHAISVNLSYGYIRVRAPFGGLLVPGTTFPTVVGLHHPARPARLEMHAVGCVPTGGTVTVHEASYDEQGDLQRLAMSFEQRCTTTPAIGVRGAVAWRAEGGLPPVDPVPLWQTAVSGLQVHPSIGSARFSFLLRTEEGATSSSASQLVARMAPGTQPPSSPGSGTPVRVIREGQIGHDRAEIDGLAPGRSYAVRFFDLSWEGRYAKPTTVVLHGTRTALSLRHDRRGPRPTLVRGRLVRSSGPAAASGRVVVLSVRHRGGWLTVPVRTGPDGRFSARVPRASRVDAVFRGHDNDLGSAASVGLRRSS